MGANASSQAGAASKELDHYDGSSSLSSPDFRSQHSANVRIVSMQY